MTRIRTFSRSFQIYEFLMDIKEFKYLKIFDITDQGHKTWVVHYEEAQK